MRNKRKILYMLFFVVIALFNIKNVYAATDYVEGPKHGVNDCSGGGGCFKGTIGFRVTIVNKKNGERCYYDPEKKEVCVDKSKYSKAGLKKLKESKSLDLWFNANELNILSSDQCYAVTGQRTKIEYIDANKTVPYDKCKKVYSKAYSMTYLGFPAASSSSYPIKWKSSGNGNIGPDNTASNMTSIVVWMLCKEYGTKTVTLGKESYTCKDQNKKVISKDLTIFSNLFSYSFYKDKTSIDVKNVTNLDNVRIEFDQLLEILDANTSWNTKAHIGLVSEATKLYKNHKSLIGDNRANGCINSSLDHGSCSSFFSSGGYLTGWRGSEKLGKLKAIDQDVFNKWSTSGVNYDNFSGNNTANVFTYWLHQDNTNPNMCETVAPKISGKTFAQYYTNLSKDKRLTAAEKKKITWMKNADYYGFKNVTQLKTYVAKSCAAPSCEESYDLHNSNNILSKFWPKVPTLANSTQKNIVNNQDGRWNYIVHNVISGYSLSRSNACNATTCQNIVKTLKLDEKKYNSLSSTKKKQVQLLGEHTSLYASNKYKNLNVGFLSSTNEKAACEGKLPDCDKIDNISKCVVPYNISIGKNSYDDKNYREECILNGILYNKGFKYYPSVNGTYNGFLDQSSMYSVYCSEKIDIDMPKINSKYTKAGRVFQWGNNITTSTNTGADSDTKNFATMTVVQQCYKGGKKANGESAIFSEAEKKRFNSLNNNLSISSGQVSSTTIDFTYKDPTNTFGFNNELYDSKLVSRKVTSLSSMIEIKSTYDFNYSNKMTWYSHKGTSEKDVINKNKYKLLSNTKKNEYVFIGYGAPTSFNTPDGTYKESITATIKNIGVSGEYKHLYSSDILEYKCDFKIHNEIIGNECCDVKTGKPFPGAPSYCTCDGGEGPKGIDVAFRTIELVNQNVSTSSINSEIDKAFPGRSGSGRYTNNNIGKNWSKIIFNDPKEALKILRSSIYSEEPQYVISLDAGTIAEIRNSNQILRDSGIDPYTYLGPNKQDTGYTCYDNDGKNKYKYCRSTFVKKYIKNGKCAQRDDLKSKTACE